MPLFDPIRDAMMGNNSFPAPRSSSTSPRKSVPPLVIPSPITPGTGSPTRRTTSSLAMLLNDPTTYISSPSPVVSTLGTANNSNAFPFNVLCSPTNRPVTPAEAVVVPPPKPTKSLMQPPPVVPAVPYNPTRISKPTTVLIPLTTHEINTFTNPVNSLRRGLGLEPSQNIQSSGGYSPSQPQVSGGYSPSQPQDLDSIRKRKRTDTDDPSPGLKRPREGLEVPDFYNRRMEVGVLKRGESPIIGLRKFNNWVKSVLIQKWAHEPLSTSKSFMKPKTGVTRSGRVLDIGCGKGGDLQKWAKARIKEYIGLDIATVSVNQARDRWKDIRYDRFDATFAQLDCYQYSISREIPPYQLNEMFDVVTMQFCMHYAFETEKKARVMLDNVSKYLRPGGRFVGTIPNEAVLIENLRAERQENPDSLEFGNDVYRVRFDSYRGPVYGHRYSFFLQDAIEDVPEYVVYWSNFEQLASEYGLKLIYKKEFHQIFVEEQDDPEFGALLKRMGVVNSENESAMDEAQWDAANVYLAFAFEKVLNR